MFRLIIISIASFLTFHAHCQVKGLWGVTKVKVGKLEMTPVAKWVRFEKGKQTSGNGWLQHTSGTYTFDRKKSTLLVVSYNEPDDGFGPFYVTRIDKKHMTWSRIEESDTVIVELKRIVGMNMSPSDEIHGLWGLERALRRGDDVTAEIDPLQKYSMFIQWTHNYVINTGREKITGLWYVNARRPELRLLRTGHEQELDTWEISVPWPPEGKSLVLKGISDNNKELVLVFKPLTKFPR